MTRAETALLLGLCASFDSRTVGEADTLAWHDVLGDLPLHDAKTAVKAHYANTRDWIMPADVRAGVKRLRRDRVEHADVKFEPTCDPDDPRAYIRQLRAHRRAFGDGNPPPESPALEQRLEPKQVAGAFKSVPPASSATRLPTQPRRESSRTLALMQARIDRANASPSTTEPLEGEIIEPTETP